MASNWKLRKDRLQEDAPPEQPDPTETSAIPEPVGLAPDEGQPEALTFEGDSSPFIFTAAEPDGTPPVAEPHFQMPDPAFSQETLTSGPFTTFTPTEAPPPEASFSETAFTILDREGIAPSLVHSEGDVDVPRVAPFIVDVPPAVESAPPQSGMLIVRIGNFAANFPLTQEVAVIGRPDTLLASYPDVEIEMDDAVSRRHAEIRRQGDGYILVDLRSTNGTLLNGERINPHQEYVLAHGDRIHLGDRTEIIFE